MEEAKQEADLDEQYFVRIKNWIFENLRFDSAQYNDSYLRRRIKSRMFYHKIDTFKEYFDFLKHYPRENEGLLKNLTINVTRFFRNMPLWLEIKELVIPEILKRKRMVKIWSAGCSSGEEPYTLAILLHEMLGNQIKDYDFRIYATDIDSEALNRALMGEYPFTALSETKPDIIQRYFRKEDEAYVVDEKIRKMVHFMQHDIFHDKIYDNLDLILCRNVVIYFRREAKEKLYLEFHKHLADQGYLVMGKTEIILGEARNHFNTLNSSEKIYQKIS